MLTKILQKIKNWLRARALRRRIAKMQKHDPFIY